MANGDRSTLRPRGLVKRDSEYPWGAWWFVADDPAGEFQRELRQVVDGTGVMIGLLPTGLGPSRDGVADQRKVSFFYSLRADAEAELRAGGLDALKRSVLQRAPELEPMLAQITTFDQLLLAHDGGREARHRVT